MRFLPFILAVSFMACGITDEPLDEENECAVCPGKADLWAAPPAGSCAARAILQVANEASFEELDIDARLNRRAARNIVDQRAISAFTTLVELDDVSYVGVSALDAIAQYSVRQGFVAACMGDAPACDDGVLNGDESDVDCGGSCDTCGRHLACAGPADCASGACVDDACVIGPTAGFRLTATTGTAPLRVRAYTESHAGDGGLPLTEYDFGDGDGFSRSRIHTYRDSGVFTVTQRITDRNGLQDEATHTVTLFSGERCVFSDTDRTPGEMLVVGEDGLTLEWNNLDPHAIRSDCSVESGVTYFEVSRQAQDCDASEAPEGCYATPRDQLSIGVATAAESLDQFPGETETSVGLDTGGSIFSDGMYRGGIDWDNTTYGFVVDYRGSQPEIHIIANDFGTTRIAHSEVLETSDPVYAMVLGRRRKIGVELRANFGSDRGAFPFAYDPAAVLRAEGLAELADAVHLGFPGPSPLVPNSRPLLTVDGTMTVALGGRVMANATASDDEDGTLTVHWENLSSAYRSAGRDLGQGVGAANTVMYTPTELGVHPLRASVVDSRGASRTRNVLVNVTGSLPQFAGVALDETDPLSGDGIEVTGLSVRYTTPGKMGIRANQGLIDGFRYFEIHRNAGPVNMGGGLSVAGGDLNPYNSDNVSPSLSINCTGSTWQNIIYRTSFDPVHDAYGFAVDYRGINPIVYYIVDGEVIDEWTMVDAFTPVYPLLYGNAHGTAPGSFDETLVVTPANYRYDARAALMSYGVSATALEMCWADADC